MAQGKSQHIFGKVIKVFHNRSFFTGLAVLGWKTYGHFHKGWRYRYAQLMVNNYIGNKKGWEKNRDAICHILSRYHPERWKKKPKWCHVADYFLCEALLGAQQYDYFNLDLFRDGWLYRRKSMGSARVVIASRVLNTAAGKQLCDDKVQAAALWNDWFKRRWVMLSDEGKITPDELKDLLNNGNRLIVKPLSEYGGKGVFSIEIDNEQELQDAVIRLNSLDRPHIVEEYICQKGLMHELNPSSMNTVRVITARYPDGTIRVMDCFIRVGHAGSVTDNASSGGMEYRVDISSGEIGQGTDYFGYAHYSHPDSGHKITGLTVPMWNEVLQFCRDAHQIAPKGLEWVGWDVCVSDNELYLIEANACPGMSASFSGGENRWKKVCALLDAHEQARLIKKTEDMHEYL